MEVGVSRLWWWNRFAAWIYHKVHGIDASDKLKHLSDCPHCKKRFDRWCAEKDD